MKSEKVIRLQPFQCYITPKRLVLIVNFIFSFPFFFLLSTIDQTFYLELNLHTAVAVFYTLLLPLQ